MILRVGYTVVPKEAAEELTNPPGFTVANAFGLSYRGA